MAKTVVETYELYGGTVKLDYFPNSHKYVIDGDRKIGVTTVTGIINKEALMLWPLSEAITYLKNALSEDTKWTTEELGTMVDNSSKAYLKKQLRGTDAGTRAHDYLERWLRYVNGETKSIEETLTVTPLTSTFGKDTSSDEYIRASDENNLCKAIDAFKVWYKENNVKMLDVEKIIYSKKYDYCGRFDAILKIDGKVYVADFKTSNPSRDFQHGVYPENFSQLGGYDIAYSEEFPDFKIDGHAVINLSKKTGKLNIELSEDREVNREFYLATLSVKRSMQFWTNKLKYQDHETRK